MDEMKDKVKGFMKKMSSSSPSSSRFKGQGRVLGSSSSGPANSILTRPSHPSNSKPTSSPAASSNPKPLTQKSENPERIKSASSDVSAPSSKPADVFDPFDPLITSGKRNPNGYSLNGFECPVCGQLFNSEGDVSSHVESCIENSNKNENSVGDNVTGGKRVDGKGELEIHVGAYLSGKPSQDSSDIVLRLLKNIVKEPENAKFRRIRMSNPKIAKAVAEAVGGVELLEFVGFQLREEEGDMWAIMEAPSKEQIGIINKVTELLEPCKTEEPQKKIENQNSAASAAVNEHVESTKIDRQTRVFYSVSENVAARIELPDSFYNLTYEELKREADMRKKKIEESQLLIPKSLKEKQARGARRKYKKCLIRIQFPDGVVLQGVFNPWEPTSSLYEFVSSALKEPSLEFELLDPVLVKRRVIPRFPAPGKKAATLEEEDLVPSALIKFKPIETDSIVFTGLSDELLQIIEPL